jgi:hypothetical protein
MPPGAIPVAPTSRALEVGGKSFFQRDHAMSISTKLRTGLFAGSLLAAAWGCDGKPAVDTSDEEVTVTGSVKVLGKTPQKGYVRFDPSNYKRKVASREAPIAKDGTYSIKTLVGRNGVSVSLPAMNLSREMDGIEVRYDAKPGPNTFDIVLPPPN